MAALVARSMITSCSKDEQVTPQSNQSTLSSGAVTPALTSKSLASTTGYTTSSAVNYSGKSNFTISGLSITGGTYCIYLNLQQRNNNPVPLANASKYEVYMTGNCKK